MRKPKLSRSKRVPHDFDRTILTEKKRQEILNDRLRRQVRREVKAVPENKDLDPEEIEELVEANIPNKIIARKRRRLKRIGMEAAIIDALSDEEVEELYVSYRG
jgi:uncharacterized membrane protein YcjF (UPF0283 family)